MRAGVSLHLASAFLLFAAACDPWVWLPTRADPDYCDDTVPCADRALRCDPATHQCTAAAPDLGAPADLVRAECVASTDCPDDRPLCTSGRCRACLDGGDDLACAMRSRATPRCIAGGRCGTCRPMSATIDCPPVSPVCTDEGTCRPCRANAECPTGVCRDDGQCESADNITWVDNGGLTAAACRAQGVHDGTTPARAYCDIQSAVDDPQRRAVIAVRGGGYEGFRVTRGTLRIVGPGAFDGFREGDFTVLPTVKNTPAVHLYAEGTTNLTVEDLRVSGGSGAPAVHCVSASMVGAAKITLKGVYARGGIGDAPAIYASLTCEAQITGTQARLSTAGIELNGATAIVSKSRIAGNTTGITAHDGTLFQARFASTLSIDASSIEDNSDQGVSCTDGSSCTLSNTLVVRNGKMDRNGSGVLLASTGQSRVDLCTIAGNLSQLGSGGVVCRNATDARVTNSIVWGNSRSPSQIDGNCMLASVVTGLGDPRGTALDVAFVNTRSDFHLVKGNANNRTCCVDQAQLQPGSGPYAGHDADSNMRPLGAAVDVGAFEAE